MASHLRDNLHSAHGSLHQNARFPKASAHDPRGLHPEDRTDWPDVLAVSYMRESSLSISLCLVHTDAEGW